MSTYGLVKATARQPVWGEPRRESRCLEDNADVCCPMRSRSGYNGRKEQRPYVPAGIGQAEKPCLTFADRHPMIEDKGDWCGRATSPSLAMIIPWLLSRSTTRQRKSVWRWATATFERILPDAREMVSNGQSAAGRSANSLSPKTPSQTSTRGSTKRWEVKWTPQH